MRTPKVGPPPPQFFGNSHLEPQGLAPAQKKAPGLDYIKPRNSHTIDDRIPEDEPTQTMLAILPRVLADEMTQDLDYQQDDPYGASSMAHMSYALLSRSLSKLHLYVDISGLTQPAWPRLD